jgi:hypothetical protein
MRQTLRRETLHGPAQRPGSPPPPSARLPVWRFFLMSHGFSWVCWVGAAL